MELGDHNVLKSFNPIADHLLVSTASSAWGGLEAASALVSQNVTAVVASCGNLVRVTRRIFGL